MKMQRLAMASVMMVVLAVASGCASFDGQMSLPGIGGNSPEYDDGTLVTPVDHATVGELARAAQAGLMDLGIPIKTRRDDTMATTFIGRTRQGTRVVVVCEMRDVRMSSLRVRVGKMGDSNASYVVRDAILERL